MITMRFWGVRGSIAAGGDDTVAVGGNTSCVEVRCGDQLIVLDAGTGLRGLGAELCRRDGRVDMALLLSHFHWDHIQGFPFFAPAYVPGNRVAVYGARGAHFCDDVRRVLEAQMTAPHFPVGLDTMRARLDFHAVSPGTSFRLGAARICVGAAHHPNGCLAYRIEHDEHSVVYATDTEHDPSGELDPSLLELARGADVLIYDAQYTPEEYAPANGGPGKRGWGHSTAAEGVRLARAAGVRELILFHHDPARDDAGVAEIEAATRVEFARTTAAREGMELVLGTPRAPLTTAAVTVSTSEPDIAT